MMASLWETGGAKTKKIRRKPKGIGKGERGRAHTGVARARNLATVALHISVLPPVESTLT